MSATGNPPLASAAVHARLRADILEGRLEPGDAVPSERALAEQLGVNRHAVREALKRLQQAGLVRISQGGATRVLDWRRTGGLEVLLDLMDAPATPPDDLIRSVLEMRQSVGVDAAVRFAERASREGRAAAAEQAAHVAAAIESGGPSSPAALTGFIALWETIVEGSDNIAYRLALNSLNAALGAFGDLAVSLIPAETGGLTALGDALRAGDAAAARRAAEGLLAPR